MLLLGQSDLAEIAALCALEQGVGVAGLVDADADAERFIGAPVFKDINTVDAAFDAVLITDLKTARATCEEAIARFGMERVMVPDLLRVHIRQQGGAAE